MNARGIMADAGMVETGSCADDGVSFGCQVSYLQGDANIVRLYVVDSVLLTAVPSRLCKLT